jgi:hypothetical protein
MPWLFFLHVPYIKLYNYWRLYNYIDKKEYWCSIKYCFDTKQKSSHPYKRTKALLTCYHLNLLLPHNNNLFKYAKNYWLYSSTITCATNDICLLVVIFRSAAQRCIQISLFCPSHHPGTLFKTLPILLFLFKALLYSNLNLFYISH